MRIDKYIQDKFNLKSRTYAENLIKTGSVLLRGKVVTKSSLDVGENDDIMIITNDGTMIRTPVSGIPVYEGNNTAGVIIMRLAADAHIISFAAVKSEEEEASKIEAAVGEAEQTGEEIMTDRQEEIDASDDDI